MRTQPVAAAQAATPMPVSPYPRNMLSLPCKFGAMCYRPNCYFSHPSRVAAAAPPCRYGARCNAFEDCGFAHPKVCQTERLPEHARAALLSQGDRVIDEIRRRTQCSARVVEDDEETAALAAEDEIVVTIEGPCDDALDTAKACEALDAAKELLHWAAYVTRLPHVEVLVEKHRGWLRKRLKKYKLKKKERKHCRRAAADELEALRATPEPAPPRTFDRAEWEAFVKRPPSPGWAAAAFCPPRLGRKRRRDYEDYDCHNLDGGGYYGGYGSADEYELLCQGVKPWDEDAGDVLAALSEDY